MRESMTHFLLAMAGHKEPLEGEKFYFRDVAIDRARGMAKNLSHTVIVVRMVAGPDSRVLGCAQPDTGAWLWAKTCIACEGAGMVGPHASRVYCTPCGGQGYRIIRP